MLASISCCISIVFIAVIQINTVASEDVCPNRVACHTKIDNNTKEIITFGSFQKTMDSRFNETKLMTYKQIVVSGTERERKQQCLLSCSEAASEKFNWGKRKCLLVILSPYTHDSPSNCTLSYNNPFKYWNVVNAVGFTMYHLLHTACEAKPCVKGYCIPDYDNGTYSCKCNSLVGGRNCDTPDWRTTDGIWNFNEGDIRNEGIDQDLVNETMTGKIIYVPDRSSRVMSCTGKNCFKVASNGDCLRNSHIFGTGDCMKGFTLAFWFRIANYNILTPLHGLINPNHNTLQSFIYNGKLEVKYYEHQSTESCCTTCDMVQIEDLLPDQYFEHWNHIAIRYGGADNLEVFVNGVKSASSEKGTLTGLAGTEDFSFGYGSSVWYVDDVMYENQALTDELIKKHYDDTIDQWDDDEE